MINWKLTLHKLFFMHEWETEDSCKVDVEGPMWNYYKITYVLRCKLCGTLKRKKIKL